MLKRWWGSWLVILVAVPGAVEWGEWPSLERLGFETHRVVTTDVGEQQHVSFANGPHVVLNTRTTIATRELRDELQIELGRGEVLIDTTAAKPSSKRLRIAAGPATIEATRAKLSIFRASHAECVVRVFSGNVTIRPDASFMSVKLQSGRSATLTPGKLIVNGFPPESAPRLLSWTTGRLIFDGQSLAEVAAEFNRYNREQLFIADDALAQFRIGGSYSAKNPTGFARALETTFRIQATSVRSGGKGASVIVLAKPKTQRSISRPSHPLV